MEAHKNWERKRHHGLAQEKFIDLLWDCVNHWWINWVLDWNMVLDWYKLLTKPLKISNRTSKSTALINDYKALTSDNVQGREGGKNWKYDVRWPGNEWMKKPVLKTVGRRRYKYRQWKGFTMDCLHSKPTSEVLRQKLLHCKYPH